MWDGGDEEDEIALHVASCYNPMEEYFPDPHILCNSINLFFAKFGRFDVVERQEGGSGRSCGASEWNKSYALDALAF